MEAIGAVSTFVGLIDVISKRLSEFRVRLDNFRQHKDRFETLVATHDRILEKLKRLQTAASKEHQAETYEDLCLIRKHITEASSDLRTLTDYLGKATPEPVSPETNAHERKRRRTTSTFSRVFLGIRRFQRATRIEETLMSVQDHLDSAWRVLSDVRLIHIEQGISAMSVADCDTFYPKIAVTPNPENLVLDFDSRDENGTPVTYEGRLKHILLATESSPCIGVIERVVTGAIGGGGMGKTCAIRQLALLKEVRETFQGGIYEISLGMDAGVSKLVEEVCDCVEISGGVKLSKKLLTERNVRRMLRKAGGWFGGHKVLFIVDDVWENGDMNRDVFLCLNMLLVHEGSRMVFTSRDTRMSECAKDVIEFETRGPFSKVSKDMFLKNARMSEDDPKVEANMNHVDSILELCGGLPVALAVAGQLVAQCGSDFDDPLGWVVSRMGYKSGAVREQAIAGYGALAILLDEAVQFCERQHGQTWALRTEKSFEQIVQSLCVLQKQQFAPASMLQRLWGLDSERNAEDLVKILKNVGLVKSEARRERGGEILGVCLHDLVQEHFDSTAKGKRKTYHEQLLSTYVEVPEGMKDEGYRAWWGVDEYKNVYLYQNLCRHLIAAELFDEAVSLLLDPRWTVKQTLVNGAAQVVRDYELVEDCVRECSIEKMNGNSRRTDAFELIRDAVTLAAPYVMRNKREIWFQLYGRLIGSEHVCGIYEYLERIQLYAEKPWVRAGKLCISPAGELVKRTWILGDGRGAIKNVWLARNGSVPELRRVARNIRSARRSKIRRIEHLSEWKCIWSMTMPKSVRDCIISNNGSKLGLLTTDGNAEAWDLEKNRRLLGEANMRDAISIGKFTADGKRWAFVCKDKSIRIWEMESGGMKSIGLLRNESEVQCVCWSDDGKLVAVGCPNGRVVVWDVNSRRIVNAIDVGGGQAIVSIAWSDNSMIATSLASGGTFLSDTAGEHGRETVQLTSFTNLDLMWSADKLLLTGARIGDVQVWETRVAPEVDEDARIMSGNRQFRSINWSLDGSKLVTVDHSNTVRVARKQIFDHLPKAKERRCEKEQENWTRVEWNEKGTLVATMSASRVWLWDTSGNCVGKLEDVSEQGSLRSAVNLTWAANGERLAAVYSDVVQVWNVQRREVLCKLRSEHPLCSGALSADGVLLAAVTESCTLLVWNTLDAHLSRMITLPVELEPRAPHMGLAASSSPMAWSHDTKFVCAFDVRSAHALVWEVGTGSLCASIRCERDVRALSFDERCNVIVEREIMMTDAASEQLGVWRWRSGETVDKLPAMGRPHVREGKAVYDEFHRCLGTFDSHFYQWSYSTRARSFAGVFTDYHFAICHIIGYQSQIQG